MIRRPMSKLNLIKAVETIKSDSGRVRVWGAATTILGCVIRHRQTGQSSLTRRSSQVWLRQLFQTPKQTVKFYLAVCGRSIAED